MAQGRGRRGILRKRLRNARTYQVRSGVKGGGLSQVG